MTSSIWRPTRRKFLTGVLHAGATSTLAAVLPYSTSDVRVADNSAPDAYRSQLADPERVQLLAHRAIDAAISAGAQYADVRLTRTVEQRYRAVGSFSRKFSSWHNLPGIGDHDYPPGDGERLAVGVRVLVDGCWGFAASPLWLMEEMNILADNAARQAVANAKATPRKVDLAPVEVVTGSWRPPGVIDPFSIPPEEKLETLRDLADYPGRLESPTRHGREDLLGSEFLFKFVRQERALATSDGTYCTQELFSTDMTMFVRYMFSKFDGRGFGQFAVDYPGSVGQGWEAVDGKLIRQRTDESLERFYASSEPSARSVDVGRYEVVCSASVTAQLVDRLFGAPTQVDRALGYEANTGGTSYIDDPVEMIGTLKVGSELLNITGNRSMPGGLATVKWDDEGVVPSDINLVKNGVLSDLQTTRETSGWIADSYSRAGKSVRSNGTASSGSALAFTLGHTPNLVMQEGESDSTFDTIVRNTKRGIAIIDGRVDVDFQARTGVCRALRPKSSDIREIVDGKLGRAIHDAGMIFEATSFWKTLEEIGGRSSVRTFGASSSKGEPEDVTAFSVSAVPIRVREATIIDVQRMS